HSPHQIAKKKRMNGLRCARRSALATGEPSTPARRKSGTSSPNLSPTATLGVGGAAAGPGVSGTSGAAVDTGLELGTKTVGGGFTAVNGGGAAAVAALVAVAAGAVVTAGVDGGTGALGP